MLKYKINRSMALLTAAGVVCALSGKVSADRVDIARLAPEQSFFVASIPDWPQLRASAEDGSLGRLWKEPAVGRLIEKLTEDQTKRFKDLLEEVRADVEDIKHPTGGIGMAIFWPDGAKDFDDEPSFLLFAELGEHADDWQGLIDKFIDRGLDQRTITLDDDSYRDVKITIISPVYDEEEHDWEMCDHDHARGLVSVVGGSADEPGKLSIARSGDSILLSTNLRALEGAIDRLNGDGRDSLAETGIYRDAVAMQGQGALAYAVLLTRPFFDAMAAEEPEMGMPNPRAIFDVLGLSAVRALSASLRLDTTDALVDLKVDALARDKEGLLALVDESAGRFDPPTFVGPGAASVSQFSFRFDKMLDMARRAMQVAPQEERAEIAAMLEQASVFAGQALDAMGPTVYTVTTYTQPYSAQSERTVYAIELRDEWAVANTIDTLVGMSGGMVETRDFDGTVLYSMDFPMQISGAVGFGRLFLGPTSAVEDALRAAGRPDGPRLAEEREFRDATRALGDNGVMYSYMDVGQYLRWSWWSIQNADQIMKDTLDRIGIDGEYREEILRHHRENQPEWQKDLPSIDAIMPHLGNLVYELQSTRDGFSGRMLLLKPRED